jgi:hypothetical protein
MAPEDITEPQYASVTGTGGKFNGQTRNFNVVAGWVFDLQPQESAFCNTLPENMRPDYMRFCIGHKLDILGNNTDTCASWSLLDPLDDR